jgi:hypothetical protein
MSNVNADVILDGYSEVENYEVYPHILLGGEIKEYGTIDRRVETHVKFGCSATCSQRL